jgi:hypothetical protein
MTDGNNTTSTVEEAAASEGGEARQPDTQRACAGAVCRCSGSTECSCREVGGTCLDCGRTMVSVYAETGMPVVADPRQTGLFG